MTYIRVAFLLQEGGQLIINQWGEMFNVRDFIVENNHQRSFLYLIKFSTPERKGYFLIHHI